MKYIIPFLTVFIFTGCSGFLPYYLGLERTSVGIKGEDGHITKLPQASSEREELLCVSCDKKSFWTVARSTTDNKNYSLYNYDLSGNLIKEIPLPTNTPWFFDSPTITHANGVEARRNSRGAVSPVSGNFYLLPEFEILYFTRNHGYSGEQCPDDSNPIKSVAVFNLRTNEYKAFPPTIWGDGNIFLRAVSADRKRLLLEQSFQKYSKEIQWGALEKDGSRYLCRHTPHEGKPKNFAFVLDLDSGTISEKKSMGEGNAREPFLYSTDLFQDEWILFLSTRKSRVLPDGRKVISTLP